MNFHEVSYEHTMLVKEGNQKPCYTKYGEVRGQEGKVLT